MRFNNKLFALVWIVLSLMLFGIFFKLYKTGLINVFPSISLVDNDILALFFMLMCFSSFVMGIFFFIFSDELATYFGNYGRKKEI